MLYGKPQNFDKIDLSNTNVLFTTSSINKDSLEFDNPICSGDWYESYRYLYCPYPTRPNDSKQTLTHEELNSITNIYQLPSNVDPNFAAYHIIGAIFGIYCEGNDSTLINIYIDQPRFVVIG